MILTGALGKVRPRTAAASSAAESVPDRAHNDEVWAIGKATWVATDAGVHGPDDFSNLEILKGLFEAEDIDMFYALLIARRQKGYGRLLSDILTKSNKSHFLPDMPDQNNQPRRPSSRPLMERYKAETNELFKIHGPQAFDDARNAFWHRVSEDEDWFQANKGKYVATFAGMTPVTHYIAASFSDALVTGREKWPGQLFHVGKVVRPPPPKGPIYLGARFYSPDDPS